MNGIDCCADCCAIDQLIPAPDSSGDMQLFCIDCAQERAVANQVEEHALSGMKNKSVADKSVLCAKVMAAAVNANESLKNDQIDVLYTTSHFIIFHYHLGDCVSKVSISMDDDNFVKSIASAQEFICGVGEVSA